MSDWWVRKSKYCIVHPLLYDEQGTPIGQNRRFPESMNKRARTCENTGRVKKPPSKIYGNWKNGRHRTTEIKTSDYSWDVLHFSIFWLHGLKKNWKSDDLGIKSSDYSLDVLHLLLIFRSFQPPGNSKVVILAEASLIFCYPDPHKHSLAKGPSTGKCRRHRSTGHLVQ